MGEGIVAEKKMTIERTAVVLQSCTKDKAGNTTGDNRGIYSPNRGRNDRNWDTQVINVPNKKIK